MEMAGPQPGHLVLGASGWFRSSSVNAEVRAWPRSSIRIAVRAFGTLGRRNHVRGRKRSTPLDRTLSAPAGARSRSTGSSSFYARLEYRYRNQRHNAACTGSDQLIARASRGRLHGLKRHCPVLRQQLPRKVIQAEPIPIERLATRDFFPVAFSWVYTHQVALFVTGVQQGVWRGAGATA
jgi:hypothetical protein